MTALSSDPDVRRVQALEAAFQDLKAFIRLFWHVVEPKAYVSCWHIDLIADELMAQDRGEIRRLCINVPPGAAKSLVVSVFKPAWTWIRDPGRRSLYVSGTDELAERDSQKCRRIMEAPWYHRLKDYAHAKHGIPRWEVSKKQDTKKFFMNTLMGERRCAGILGMNTGKRGDELVIDDPVAVKKTLGAGMTVRSHMEAVNSTIETELMSRVNDAINDPITMIMQRLADDDPAGQFMKKPGVRRLILPATGDPDREFCHPRDLRLKGEMLSPRFSLDVLQERRREMGSVQYEAQYEQNTRPAGGSMFNEAWFMRPNSRHRIFTLDQFDECAITVDTTFTSGPKADWCVAQAWGRTGAMYYLIDQIRGRWEYVEARDKIREFRRKHGRAGAVLIETSANGRALIDDLKTIIPGVIGIKPEGDKESRAHYLAVAAEAGNLRIPEAGICAPDESGQPWIDTWLDEVLRFPLGRHDDQVDAASQILVRWHATVAGGAAKAAMQQAGAWGSIRGLGNAFGR